MALKRFTEMLSASLSAPKRTNVERHRPKKAQQQMCHTAHFLNSLHTLWTFTAAQRLGVNFHVHLFAEKRGGGEGVARRHLRIKDAVFRAPLRTRRHVLQTGHGSGILSGGADGSETREEKLKDLSSESEWRRPPLASGPRRGSRCS